MDQRTDVFEDVQAIRHKLKVSVKNLRNLVESLTTNSDKQDERLKTALLVEARHIIDEVSLILLAMKVDIANVNLEVTQIRLLAFLLKSNAELEKILSGRPCKDLDLVSSIVVQGLSCVDSLGSDGKLETIQTASTPEANTSSISIACDRPVSPGSQEKAQSEGAEEMVIS
ncbi:hypothetical protein LENED_011695 [Lentinula edodes]|uniref:Uncharacterized protein n=1 Tax=Lentinula edodes TaxID=5353 RepID=A0A1Q3ER07_LENED|nr:uncharacterized protein C8R40DRAFT_1175711 [Lentinula edodes]KAH7870448.1 hypothetical protein C8R40DRAFT_1175711 [Lentinula edodes]GAW09534.1 hypothetical protein LENED_011695 [Lentinula edodes]